MVTGVGGIETNVYIYIIYSNVKGSKIQCVHIFENIKRITMNHFICRVHNRVA